MEGRYQGRTSRVCVIGSWQLAVASRQQPVARKRMPTTKDTECTERYGTIGRNCGTLAIETKSPALAKTRLERGAQSLECVWPSLLVGGGC